MPALTRASWAPVFRLNFPLLTALLLLIALNLGIGRGTQTDDAHRVSVPDGIDRHVKAIGFGCDADPALLVRRACVIEGDLHRVPVELARQIERHTVSTAVRLVLLWVELEIHEINCTYKKCRGQRGARRGITSLWSAGCERLMGIGGARAVAMSNGTTRGTTGDFGSALKDWSERRDLNSGPLAPHAFGR